MKFSSIPIYVKLDESNAYPVAIKKYEKYSKVVFDCAGLDGQRLEAVNKIISELSPVDTQPEDTSFVAANHLQAFFLNPEHITFRRLLTLNAIWLMSLLILTMRYMML